MRRILYTVCGLGLLFAGAYLVWYAGDAKDTQVAALGAVSTASTTPSIDEQAQATNREIASEQVATPNNAPVRVPILVYHGVRDTTPDEAADVRQFNISPSVLDEQFAYLRDHGFTPITFTDLDAYFDTGAPLPEKPVILTFDDGWRTQFENALPLLTTYGFRATFFFFPNGLGHENFMSWDEARELVTAGMEIGSHSQSHLYMTKQDAVALQKELAGSKEWLEEELRVPVAALSYPFGLYSEEIIALAEETGYTTARTLTKTTIHTRDARLELGSYLVGNNMQDFRYILDVVEVGVVAQP
jgi:peptidoglycan/xylan/chitin deacetylase (PgdA/CDA1 family)